MNHFFTVAATAVKKHSTSPIPYSFLWLLIVFAFVRRFFLLDEIDVNYNFCHQKTERPKQLNLSIIVNIFEIRKISRKNAFFSTFGCDCKLQTLNPLISLWTICDHLKFKVADIEKQIIHHYN